MWCSSVLLPEVIYSWYIFIVVKQMMSSFGAIHDDIDYLKPAKEFLQRLWNVLSRPGIVKFPKHSSYFESKWKILLNVDYANNNSKNIFNKEKVRISRQQHE